MLCRQGKEHLMNTKWIVTATLAIFVGGCANRHGQSSTGTSESKIASRDEAPEPGETKISLDQAPPAVRKTIEHELIGAQLEDIAKKERAGKTVYETDVIRNGHKWELGVTEDGNIISKSQEGAA